MPPASARQAREIPLGPAAAWPEFGRWQHQPPPAAAATQPAGRGPRISARSRSEQLRRISSSVRFVSELGDPQQLLAELREPVAAVEAAVAAERLRAGAGVLGPSGNLAAIVARLPCEPGTRRNFRPRIAARNPWARLEALRRNREFLAAYRDARARWDQLRRISLAVRFVRCSDIVRPYSGQNTPSTTWSRQLGRGRVSARRSRMMIASLRIPTELLP
jgi:hypothetical protein